MWDIIVIIEGNKVDKGLKWNVSDILRKKYKKIAIWFWLND